MNSIVPYEKKIPLSKGAFALVGYWVYAWLMQWNWTTLKTKHFKYARANVKVDGKRKIFFMHRFILNAPSKMMVDHKDHDGLNCLPDNIRICTCSQNTANKIKRRGASKFLGVSVKNARYKDNRFIYWRASIRSNGVEINLGNFKTEEEAAKAYDIAAQHQYKEFANPNFK